MKTETTKPDRDDFLQEARKRFERAEQAESLIRDRGADDLRMRAGDQWDADVRKSRLADGRPCLTVNRLPQFLHQVTNDQRQNRPAIQVSPVDDKADPETAKVFQGLVKHIEYDSGADAAYDTAFEGAAGTGIGYFRVITEYSSPMSFDLDIKIKRIRNQFSVYIDPDAKEADRSDMRWAFIVDDFSKDAFEARYPDSDLAKGDSGVWDMARQQAPTWMQGDSVRVAEYFCITTKKVTICQTVDGRVVEKTKLSAGDIVTRERVTEVPSVKWTKIVGTEVLEETEWPGLWIPIIPVLGDELEVDGQVILESVFRHAKDTQKMLNVWVSAETETVGLAPRAPWIVAEGQLEGREKDWKTANTKNHAFLTYRPTSLNGATIGAPQRVFGEANVQAITNARMQAQDDLKGLIGIYDSALGAQGNETSGVAIRSRQSQSGTANFHLVDNLTRAIRHLGRILIDLIPKIYDTARAQRIIGEEGDEETVLLNQLFIDPKTNQERYIDLGVGKYDVRCNAGPSFATKRQEAVASMMQLAQADPTLTAKAGDLLVKNMDWPGAKEISERLAKFLPPEVKDQDPKDPAAQVPPELQAKLQEQGQMIEQLTQAMQQAQGQVAQAEQAASEAQGQVKSKQDEMMFKGQELEMRGQLESAKLQLDAQKLDLDQQKLNLEAQKMRIEEVRLRTGAATGPVRADLEGLEGPEHEGVEHEVQLALPITRDELAQHLQTMGETIVMGIAAAQPQPMQMAPMPPQRVVLMRTADGGLVGHVEEAL